jgi:hypothetical protein
MAVKDLIQIVSLALNNIKLDEIIQIDKTNGSSNIGDLQNQGEVGDKITGLYAPLITINGYNVTKYLTKFHLDLNGFLPTVRFSFIAAESVFISVNYPKDGDIVSVYMRSPGDFYKPLRMDFNVLNVISEPSSRYSSTGSDPDGKGINLRFTILGECRIPGLYTSRIKSFPNLTSNDCLLDVSQELNLGFSTNEKNTLDRMTWICPSYSYYDFIQEVSLRAYKDDQGSFFDCWVDPYYNLNFVNMGSQFSFTGDPKVNAVFLPGFAAGGAQAGSAIPGSPDPDPVEMPLVLTNLVGYGTIPYFVNGYTLTSRAGANTNRMGYITEIGFYDETSTDKDPSKKYIKYDIESQTQEDIGIGTILQKGRARDNEYKNEKRIEWLGVFNPKISQNDGVHENYFHAKYQNLINLSDCTKMTLEVELANYFPGIYRGQVLPVTIYVNDGGVRQQNAGDQKNSESNTALSPVVDNFLSGNYVVVGISVSWSYASPGMRQHLTLAKRQWTANSSGSLPKAFPISISKKLF